MASSFFGLKYKVFKNSFTFVAFCSLTSCFTQIDLRVDLGAPRIVISGQISTISDRNIVSIGKTADKQRLPFPVEGASVMLIDEFSFTRAYLENPDKPGEYVLNGFASEAGASYSLKVMLSNGEIYQSTSERIPLVAGEVSAKYEIQNENFTDNEGIVSEQRFFKIFTDSSLPEAKEDIFLKWGVEEVFAIVPTDFPDIAGFIPPNCYVYQNADPQRVVLFTGAELATKTITKNLVASRIVDYSFFDRHYFTIYQSSITKDAYDYWRKVNVLANQVGSIFDTPPAEITGNIVNINNNSEKVLGYFQATNQVFDRFFTLPVNLPFPLLFTTCNYDQRDNDKYPQRCLDCITVRGSSYVRPPWF